jgi:carboxymethylenebutenolidase
MKMKAILGILFSVFFAHHAFAQHSCCQAPFHSQAVTAMQDLASDPTFAKAHADPLPFDGQITDGQMITFRCSDRKDGNAFVVYSKEHPNDILLLFHEWWGLNDYIKQEAVRLSKALDVTVCAIDLFDGKVATTSEEAGKYVGKLKQDRGLALIQAAYSYFPAEAHYATIGWCFGGSWSMQAAMFPTDKRVAGCVIYYGMPELDVNKLRTIHFPIIGIFGKQDQYITPEVVTNFQKAMKKAGKKLTVFSYDADHGFANPSNPHHNEEATTDAAANAEKFLKKVFNRK